MRRPSVNTPHQNRRAHHPNNEANVLSNHMKNHHAGSGRHHY
jgi:hypothetical protein